MLKNALIFLLGFVCAAGSLLVFHPRWWPEPHPERKLEGVYLATRSIEGAIAVGVTRPAFDILVQKLSTEILLAEDRIDADSTIGAYHLMAYKGILKEYERSAGAWDGEISSKAKASEFSVEKGASEVAAKYQQAAMKSEELVHALWDEASQHHKSEIATWK